MHSSQGGQESSADAFTREIIRNKLLAIASEMGIVLARTSMSPIVYEVLDFACGITDANGAGHRPGQRSLPLHRHLQTAGRVDPCAVIPLAAMRPGDIYMTNGPYGGGTHTADVALVMPIFAGERVIAFGISVTHWTEIGGKVLGSLSPDSTEIFQEGLQFPQLRLYREGELNERVVELIRANVRLPRMSLGDLNAGVAAVRIAEERLREYRRTATGWTPTLETFDTILDHGEALARDALAASRRRLRGGGHHRRRRRHRRSDPGSRPRHGHAGAPDRRFHRHVAPNARPDQLRSRRADVRLQNGLQGDHRARKRPPTKGCSGRSR